MRKLSLSAVVSAMAAVLCLSSCAGGNEMPQSESEIPEIPSPNITSEGNDTAVSGQSGIETSGSKTVSAAEETDVISEIDKAEAEPMKIKVTDGTHTVVFELNDSKAAKSLYDQLPLTLGVENYSDDEKIFYPEKLDTSDPVDADAKKGTLAYFSPWGDVVMYYRDYGSYPGLYELGQAVSGAEEIEHLSGTLQITKE